MVEFATDAKYDAVRYSHYRTQRVYRGTDEDTALPYASRVQLQERCKNLYRNNSLVRSIVDRYVTNVVGSGIYPHAITSDCMWNDINEEQFSYWSENCDINDRLSLYDIQKLCIIDLFLSGEFLIILLGNGKIQKIDTSRLVTPTQTNDERKAREARGHLIVDGIELNSVGKIVGYHIAERATDGTVDPANTRYVEARNAIYVSERWTTDQLRGTPLLSSVITLIEDHDDLQKSVLAKARLEAKSALKVKLTNPSSQFSLPGELEEESEVTKLSPHEDPDRIQDIEGVSTYYLRDNEDVESVFNATPGNNYDAYDRRLIEKISAAISLPYQVTMMQFDNSFSSSRTAILQAYNAIEFRQNELINKMLNRLYNWVTAKAIKSELIPPAPLDIRGISEWYKVRWALPSKDWLDPSREAQANRTKYDMGITSLGMITRGMGNESEDVLREKGEEIARAIELAKDLSKETGAEIKWYHLISPPAGSTIKLEDNK